MKVFVVLASVLVSQIIAFPGQQQQQQQQPLVVTPKGTVLGTTFKSRLGKTIFGFRGIRYAKAPVNELRFQPPQPPEEWRGTLNATEDAPVCPQEPYFGPMSEDCLFLNVYTTRIPTRRWNPRRPVIVYFHAGAFVGITGKSNWAGPEYLLDENVVLVTLNYRLGVLGFISTGEKEAPGNLGLKDQVQALRWVKQNIRYFGGDPNSVTIYGYSAGSASVMLHMMSPMSKGLFHKAIAGSASALGTWPTKTHQLDLVKKQARVVGCPDDTTPSEIIKCLKTIPAETLGPTIPQLKSFGYHPILIWEPVIEPDFGQERFLTDNPVQLAVNGQFENVPFMTGITTEEFSYAATDILSNETLLSLFNNEFDKYAPIVLDYEQTTEKSIRISQALRKYYFGDGKIENNNSTSTKLGQLLNDGLTGFGVNRAAKLFSAKSSKPVFYYEFSYQGRYSHVYLPGTNNTVPYGVVHHDDLIYLFYISTLFPKFTANDPESKTVDKMIKMWANFARKGNPIPEPSPLLDDIRWEPFTASNGKYMKIGETLEMDTNLYGERYKVWEDILPLPTETAHQ